MGKWLLNELNNQTWKCYVFNSVGSPGARADRRPVVISHSHENGVKRTAVETTLAAGRHRRENFELEWHRRTYSNQKPYDGRKKYIIAQKRKQWLISLFTNTKRKWKGRGRGNGKIGFCRFWVGFCSSPPSNNLSARQPIYCWRTSASVLPITFRRLIWQNGFSLRPILRRVGGGRDRDSGQSWPVVVTSGPVADIIFQKKRSTRN